MKEHSIASPATSTTSPRLPVHLECLSDVLATVVVLTDNAERPDAWHTRAQILLALPTWRTCEIDEALERLVATALAERKGSELRATNKARIGVDTAHLQLEVYRARLKAMITANAEDDRAFMLAHYADLLPGGDA